MTTPASGRTPTDGPPSEGEKRSVFSLIGDLPRLIVANLRAEFDLIRAELTAKATKAIVGIVLAVVALVLMFFGIGVLLDSAVAALAQVWPEWLAALVVGGGIIVVVLVLVFAAIGQFRSIGSAGRDKPGMTDDEKKGADA